MHDAQAEVRAALDDLISRSTQILREAGFGASPQHLDKVRETLEAAALDLDARAQVEAGRLSRELRHAGFGAIPGLALVPAPEASLLDEERAERRERKEIERRVRRLESEADAAAAQAERLAGEAERARLKAEEARRTAQEARAFLDRP